MGRMLPATIRSIIRAERHAEEVAAERPKNRRDISRELVTVPWGNTERRYFPSSQIEFDRPQMAAKLG